ncbi:MAG TPA: L,D-transpeptidase family protein [Steroidobacteraceae bacterium]|nr:L,D-transpeptidase family protein [Steroidobacteraceae bacterium]
MALLALVVTAPTLAQMLPTSMPHYRLLQQALTRYRTLAADPTLTRLPPLPARSVKPGEAYAGGEALRRLLRTTGDLTDATPPGSPAVLDAALVAALRHFQRRHGLTEDGVLGRATWRALTTPLAQRVKQIERTLQRWEQLPPSPGTRTIFINIPQFRLIGLHSAQDTEAQMLRMNVVVGRNERRLRTPSMVTELTDVIFHPYWDVPRSILRNELLPLIRRNPGYIESNNMEIVGANGALLAADGAGLAALAEGRARLRQRPGPDNALGRVKFVLANDMAIYLHDTPATALFERARRTFSHGCVRVADPLGLAQFALQDAPAWPLERIQEMLDGGETLRVRLPAPIRVYIVYGTALALESGEVRFYDDVYGLDGPG